MLKIRESREQNAALLYGFSVVVIVVANGGAFWVLLGDFNIHMAAVLVLNIVVFTWRAIYAICHRTTLFSKKHYRSVEAATNAERVALYGFAVVMGAGLIAEGSDGLLTVDESLGDVGQGIILLILVSPMVTYLTSGYGKFRDIVLEPEESTG